MKKVSEDFKINVMVVPITLFIVIIVTLLLVFLTPKSYELWKFYLIGSLLGLMLHGMMVKENARLKRFNKLDPEHKTFNPRKSAILWFLLRMLAFGAVFFTMGYISKDAKRIVLLVRLLTALGGYMTLKIVFLTICIIFLKKGEGETE